MQHNDKQYIAKSADANGVVHYDTHEHQVWKKLLETQHGIIKQRACNEFIAGLALLNLPKDRIPQCGDVSAVLQKTTGWVLEPVPALISFDHFFSLLAKKRFPAATFIRRLDELEYLKEPDIFHEVFGHCPLLTNPAYAEFVYNYGKLGCNASADERVLLARLFWFTIEFGLLQTPNGLRAYGGGILSSAEETVYSLESHKPKRITFSIEEALRTNYRIDELQPVYFVLNSLDELFDLIRHDLLKLIRNAHLEQLQIPKHPC